MFNELQKAQEYCVVNLNVLTSKHIISKLKYEFKGLKGCWSSQFMFVEVFHRSVLVLA